MFLNENLSQMIKTWVMDILKGNDEFGTILILDDKATQIINKVL